MVETLLVKFNLKMKFLGKFKICTPFLGQGVGDSLVKYSMHAWMCVYVHILTIVITYVYTV